MVGTSNVSSLKENLKKWPRCMDWKKNEQFGEKQIIKIIDLNRTKRKRADDLNKAEEIMLKTSWVTLCIKASCAYQGRPLFSLTRITQFTRAHNLITRRNQVEPF